LIAIAVKGNQKYQTLFSIALILAGGILTATPYTCLVETGCFMGIFGGAYLALRLFFSAIPEERKKGDLPAEEEDIIRQIDEGKISFAELSVIWTKKTKTKEAASKGDDEEIKEREETITTQPEKEVQPDVPEDVQKTESVQKSTEETIQETTEIQTTTTTEEEEKKLEDEQEFRNDIVREIYTKFCVPYIISKEYLKVSKCLLKMLDKVANSPSVSSSREEKEESEESFHNTYDVYSQITLAEHTFHVVEQIYHLTREMHGETWKVSWPAAFVVAVAHDLGKALEFQIEFQEHSVYYGGHAAVSAELFQKCAENVPVISEMDSTR
jgi:hypothetical protein